jgi:hypothetical protein
VIDKKVFYSAAATAAVLFACLSVQGCDLQKMISVDVPGGVQDAIDAPEDISLSESGYLWDQWQNWVDANSKALARNIEDGNERVALIENVTAMGIGALGEVSGNFPGGAILFSGLSLMTGWFLKRPKEDKVVAKEKEDSYNAGLEKGKELAKTIEEVVS